LRVIRYDDDICSSESIKVIAERSELPGYTASREQTPAKLCRARPADGLPRMPFWARASTGMSGPRYQCSRIHVPRTRAPVPLASHHIRGLYWVDCRKLLQKCRGSQQFASLVAHSLLLLDKYPVPRRAPRANDPATAGCMGKLSSLKLRDMRSPFRMPASRVTGIANRSKRSPACVETE
jgi:hypothetical protein